MQETTYRDGRKELRIGPMDEVLARALKDLEKEDAVGVRIQKLSDSTLDSIRRAIEEANDD